MKTSQQVKIARAIWHNCLDREDGSMSFSDFDEQQKALWRLAEAQGISSDVSRIIKGMGQR